MAHEIAHYVLHRDLFDDLVDDEMYRSNLSSYLERQANAYAAKLLLPAAAVRREASILKSPASLAHRFNVSERALIIRLKELGLD